MAFFFWRIDYLALVAVKSLQTSDYRGRVKRVERRSDQYTHFGTPSILEREAAIDIPGRSKINGSHKWPSRFATIPLSYEDVPRLIALLAELLQEAHKEAPHAWLVRPDACRERDEKHLKFKQLPTRGSSTPAPLTYCVEAVKNIRLIAGEDQQVHGGYDAKAFGISCSVKRR